MQSSTGNEEEILSEVNQMRVESRFTGEEEITARDDLVVFKLNRQGFRVAKQVQPRMHVDPLTSSAACKRKRNERIMPDLTIDLFR